MSTSVGSIHYDLDLRTEKFTASAMRVKAQMASMSSSVTKDGKAVESSATGIGSGFMAVAGKATLITAAVIGIGTAAYATIKPLVSVASEAENLRTSLDVLTGSAENGARMFKQLTTFAAETPFETTELVEATKTMLAMGISVEKVLPNLRMLGDISLGNREKLASLTLVYGQISSKGRLMGDDLRQLWNVGFNPLDYWVQKSGKSMEYWQDQVSEGKVSIDMVTEAMQAATSEGGRFYQGMAKQSKTLEGRLSTLRDNAKTALRALMGIDAEGNIKSGGLYDSLSKAIEKLGPWLEKLATDYAPKAGQAIANFIQATSKFIEENKWFVDAIKVLAVVLGVLLAGTLIMVAGLVILPVQAFNWLKDTTINLWQAVSEAFRGIVTSISNALNTVWGVVTGVFSAIWSFISPTLNFIKNLFIIVWGSIFLVVYNTIKAINDVVFSVFNAVWGFINNIWNAIRNTIVNYVNMILNFFAPAWNWLYGAGRGVIQGLINGIGAMAGGLWNTIAWVSGHIGRFFAGAGGWLWGVGVAIIQGLLNGMSHMAGAVYGKAQEIANRVTSTIRNALNVRSPSRVMMGIGGNVAQGLALGIQKGMSAVENISANMANAVIEPVANTGVPVSNNTTTTIQMGDIHIADNATADYFFSKLNRNNELVQKGLTTI